MPASQNKRIFYAVQQVGVRPDGTSAFATGHEIHGAQSAGMTTNFNLDQVFELGQLAIYENVEEIPDVEVTLNKVLDGYPLIYHLSTTDALTPTLSGRSNEKAIFGLSIFDDTLESAVGTAHSTVECSGMFVGSLSYNFPLDDSFNEDITLVGNDKIWLNDPKPTNPNLRTVTDFSGEFGSLDAPVGTGGVNRRENLILIPDGSAGLDNNFMVDDVDVTVLPPEVFGVSDSGINEKSDAPDFDAHLSSITVSADLGRENINELGRKGPYHRVVTFPIEVTCEIEVTTTSGDMISATEAGIYTTGTDPCEDGGNLKDRTIRIATCEGTRIYLGLKNKLSSVNYTGGDAGGGNVTVTYTFTTFNDFTVMHTGDPNANFDSNLLATRQTYLRG